jgi:Cdc6-like AAA superfamily ATPase
VWELRQILGQRAKEGLDSASDEVLAKISALTTKYTNSDARVALKTLYYWAVEPKTPLEDNFQKARRDLVAEVVKNLNDKSLLILRAAGAEETPVKVVYENYRRLCRQYREEPFSYVHFYSSLAYLQSLGLILLTSTKIRRSYTKLLQLTFPVDVLDAVWRYRFA